MKHRRTGRPAHRPRGEASRQILIFARNDLPGYYLHIGLTLYELLQRPRAVRIEQRPGGWLLVPAKLGEERAHSVYHFPRNTPRMRLSQGEFEELGLTIGRYPVLILNGAAHF